MNNVKSLTEILNFACAGDPAARNTAYGVLYPHLRASAAFLLRRERRSHSIQPTDLVGEVFLKLYRLQAHIASRHHFLSIASRAMRQFLIDRSRGKAVRQRLDPEVLNSAPLTWNPETASSRAVRQVWERLQKLDPEAAEAVCLLRVENMTLNEVAAKQQRPVWRVRADCAYAEDWMRQQLR